MSAYEKTKLFLLGAIAAALVIGALRPDPDFAFAAPNAGRAGDVIAVTGPKDASLFLVDTTNKQIAHYGIDNALQMKLRGARYYNYDHQIYDASRRQGYDVDEAEKEAESSAKQYR